MALSVIAVNGPKFTYRDDVDGSTFVSFTRYEEWPAGSGQPVTGLPPIPAAKTTTATNAGDQTDPPQSASTTGSSEPYAKFGDKFSYAYRDNVIGAEMPSMGVKSLFNEYSMFRYVTAAGDYNRLYDTKQNGPTPGYSRNPTAHNIIEWSQANSGEWNPFGATPYSYSDFLYCKFYGHVPNNYMVTLRRYPIPMTDNVQTHDGSNIPPIAQAVTFMGEETENKLSDMLKFTAGLNWKDIEAKVQEISGNERGNENSIISGLPGGGALGNISGFLNPQEYSGQAQAESDYAKEAYGSEGPYANKVYGPVNVVNKTMARDQGLHFEQEIELKFHYKLNVESNINPKMAMLDIIGNMLTLCYNNAKFWGGAVRYFPQHPNKPMIGGKPAQDAFYSGDVGGYIDEVLNGEKGLSSMKDNFLKTFQDLLQDPLKALTDMATGGAKMAMGNFAQKDRPQIIAMRSLLTGDPVGEWHLVIGNPMNPIAMVGNLICTDISMTTSDILGADDFPTEIMFTVKLNHGKPRDKGDIESMFNLGNGRLYYGINDDAVFSSTTNSNIDTAGQKGTLTNNTELGKRGATPLTASQIQERQNAQRDLKIPGKSIWGTKFQVKELKIAKTWAGDAKPKPSNES